MAGFWDWLKKTFGDAPLRPQGAPESAPSASTPGQTGPGQRASGLSGSGQGSKGKKGGEARSYDANPEILGLSEAELRKRALKITPWRTAWIGRVDTIPPQSDDRTAIIDRGLILSGRLTEAEIAEIHEVGDLWLKYHGQAEMARAAGIRAADAAHESAQKTREALKAEKKAASAEKKRLRADAILERRRTDIFYLGRSVSSKLADRRSNIEKLEKGGLPILASPKDVADFLGVTIPRLRFLAFHADASTRTHYVQFQVKKRSGGLRLLSAPHKDLKAAQRKIAAEILAKVDPGGDAHGFVKDRSTVTNAAPHVGQDIVLNLDLENFFPSVTFPRARGLYQSLGYSPAAATILALLSTEAPRRLVKYDGKPYHVAVGVRSLPQGAPTSPSLANLVSRHLDRRLHGLAVSAGWTYTRYADDLTFSARGEAGKKAPWLMRQVVEIVQSEGFKPHPKKKRVQRKGGRQTVTGVVVNRKMGLPREEVRRLRAILHQAKKTGLDAQNREGRPHFAAYLRGKIAYVSMVDPVKGQKLRQELDALEKR